MKNNILLILVTIPLVLFFAFDANAFGYSDSEYKGKELLIDKKRTRIIGQNLGWLESCGRGGRARDLKDEIKFLSYADYRQINLGYAKFQSGGIYAIGCGEDYQVISDTERYIQDLKNRVNAKNKTTTSSSTTTNKKLIYCKRSNGTVYSTYNKKCNSSNKWISKFEYDKIIKLSKNNSGRTYCKKLNGDIYETKRNYCTTSEIVSSKQEYERSLKNSQKSNTLKYCKIKNGSTYSTYKKCGYREEITKKEYDRLNSASSTEMTLYCKRYDGKVFKRNKTCGTMDEISFVEFVSREIGNGEPGYYCKRPNGTVYTTSYKYNCHSNTTISYDEYKSIINPDIKSYCKKLNGEIYATDRSYCKSSETVTSKYMYDQYSKKNKIIPGITYYYCKRPNGTVYPTKTKCQNKDKWITKPEYEKALKTSQKKSKNNIHLPKGFENGIFELKTEYLDELEKLTSSQIKKRFLGTHSFGTIVLNEKKINRFHEFFSSDGTWSYFELDENKYDFSHTIGEYNQQGKWHIKEDDFCIKPKDREEGCSSLYQFRNNEINNAIFWVYDNKIYAVTSHTEKTKKFNFNQARTIVLNKLEKEKANYKKALNISSDFEKLKEEYFISPYVLPFNVIHFAKNNYGKDDILVSFASASLRKAKNESLIKCLDEKSKRSIESQCELLFINFDIFKDVNEDEKIEYLSDDDYIEYAGIFYTIKNANIRSAPNLKETTEILFTVPKGEVVEVLAKAAYDPDWVQVRYLGTYGYMHFPLLSKDQILLKDLQSEVTEVDDKSPATADENPGMVVDLSNVIRKRLIDLNELFELELIAQDEYEQRKFLLLDQVDSGFFLMDLLTEKLITREEFDIRFNELLLNAKETMEKEDKEFPIADLLKDLLDTDQEKETNKENMQLSISEIDLLRQQLSSCWIAPAGAVIEKGMIVKISAKIRPNRRVYDNSVRIVDTNISKSNSFYGPITESAMRTLLNPECIPLKLPKDKYDLWKNITLTFDYSIMKGYQ